MYSSNDIDPSLLGPSGHNLVMKKEEKVLRTGATFEWPWQEFNYILSTPTDTLLHAGVVGRRGRASCAPRPHTASKLNNCQ